MESDSNGTSPWKLIWNSLVSLKVSFLFVWGVWWGKILTTENLKKRGFQLASRCPLCSEVEENLNHLLLHCLVIWGLWEGLIYLLGFFWVYPFAVKDLLLEWPCFPIRKNLKKSWKAMPLCLIWSIWKEFRL